MWLVKQCSQSRFFSRKERHFQTFLLRKVWRMLLLLGVTEEKLYLFRKLGSLWNTVEKSNLNDRLYQKRYWNSNILWSKWKCFRAKSWSSVLQLIKIRACGIPMKQLSLLEQANSHNNSAGDTWVRINLSHWVRCYITTIGDRAVPVAPDAITELTRCLISLY